MPLRDILGAVLLICTSLGYLYSAQGLPASTTPGTPGPSLYPTFIGVCTLLLSVALLIKGILRFRTEPKEIRANNGHQRSVLTLASVVAYVVLVPYGGFLITSMVLFAVLMVLYGARKPLQIGIASA